MTDQQYEDVDLVSVYDILNPLAADSDYFIAACAPQTNTVLDLGCGTGLLTTALANLGHQATGIDPAARMLELARKHDTDGHVNWILADARTLNLNRQFDRIIAAGHVFQVFIAAEDQLAFLATAARHLSPTGRLIFETRNPAISPWLKWTPQEKRCIDHPAYGQIEIAHTVTNVKVDYVDFITSYHLVFQGRTLTNKSRLAFPTFQQVKDRLRQAGLEILTAHGDWDGSCFTSNSNEIIITAMLSRDKP